MEDSLYEFVGFGFICLSNLCVVFTTTTFISHLWIKLLNPPFFSLSVSELQAKRSTVSAVSFSEVSLAIPVATNPDGSGGLHGGAALALH